jgi:hypothetical protein
VIQRTPDLKKLLLASLFLSIVPEGVKPYSALAACQLHTGRIPLWRYTRESSSLTGLLASRAGLTICPLA